MESIDLQTLLDLVIENINNESDAQILAEFEQAKIDSADSWIFDEE